MRIKSMTSRCVLVAILLAASFGAPPAYGATLGTSASAPSPDSSYSSTTGLFSSTSGAVSVSSDGTEMMRVNGAGVGIGVTSPGGALDVESSTLDAPIGIFRGDNSYGSSDQLQITGESNTSYGLFIGYNTSSNYASIQSWYDGSAGGPLVLEPNGGNIGIGNAGPAVSLDISQRTDAVALPVGTTGQRPSGSDGEIRYNSSTSVVEAYEDGAWIPLSGAGSAIFSSGQLLCGGSVPPCHSSTLSYCPYKGNLKTTANYGVYTIPSGTAASGCLTASLASMYIGGTASQAAAASTLYYVYLINVSGTTYLDLETTGHATDSTTGIEIESGSNTRTLVGMIHTDSSKDIATQGDTSVSGDTNTVATWDNRVPTATRCAFTTSRTINTTGLAEINSENRCQFMSWADAASFLSWQGAGVNTANAGLETYLYLDSNIISATALEPSAVIPYVVEVVFPTTVGPTEGYHVTKLYGAIAAGTATYGASAYTTVSTIQ
jgi:hypothetical protein